MQIPYYATLLTEFLSLRSESRASHLQNIVLWKRYIFCCLNSNPDWPENLEAAAIFRIRFEEDAVLSQLGDFFQSCLRRCGRKIFRSHYAY